MAELRMGILGAARIAPPAVIKPARRNDEVVVTTIAARDRTKSEKFARKHGIGTVHDSYDALLADPNVDAIYNPLPNGLHGKWTIAALEAGKHVLCEKPFTANADEAREVAAVAERTGLVVMEAFHYRYHPLAARLIELAQDGTLGEIEQINTWMIAPLVSRKDIRWQLDLAGGSTMDMGCYTIHLLRSVAGEEPDVEQASARERSIGVDRWLRAEMRFPSGARGTATAAMLGGRLLRIGAEVRGTKGSVRVFNPFAPQYFHRFVVRTRDGTRRERFGRVPTYDYQLRAFAGAVLRGEDFPTNTADAIANMTVIDAAYRAAGLEPRQPSR